MICASKTQQQVFWNKEKLFHLWGWSDEELHRVPPCNVRLDEKLFHVDLVNVLGLLGSLQLPAVRTKIVHYLLKC